MITLKAAVRRRHRGTGSVKYEYATYKTTAFFSIEKFKDSLENRGWEVIEITVEAGQLPLATNHLGGALDR